MNHKSRLFTAAVGFLILFTSVVVGRSDASDPQLQVTIRVYDYAGTPEQAIGQMKTEFRWIMSKSGVSVSWLNCMGANQDDRYAGCAAPLSSSELVLRIIPRLSSSAALPQLDQDALGFTSAKATGGGKMVSLSLAAAEPLAGLRIASLGKIMAYVAAHEIGHLFLGSGHTPRGIMTPLYRSAELQQMKMRQLIFNLQQEQALRSGIQKRMEDARANTQPAVVE